MIPTATDWHKVVRLNHGYPCSKHKRIGDFGERAFKCFMIVFNVPRRLFGTEWTLTNSVSKMKPGRSSAVSVDVNCRHMVTKTVDITETAPSYTTIK